MRKARKLDVACPNCACKNYGKVGLRNIIRDGKQSNGTQRYCCKDCNRTFARTINTPFYRKRLKKQEVIRICKLLTEKMSLRGIARSTGHHQDTIRNIAQEVGAHSAQFNTLFVKELSLTPVEVDELWSFLKKKKRTV